MIHTLEKIAPHRKNGPDKINERRKPLNKPG